MNSLPEKFAIAVDQSHPEIADWFNKNSQTNNNDYEIYKTGYFHYPYFKGVFNCHQYLEVNEGYTLITAEQFLEATADPKPHPLIADLPIYYNNENGSLYKVANDRGWNSYLFDLVKRLERGGKKDPIRQEIEKSIGVLQLWLKEL